MEFLESFDKKNNEYSSILKFSKEYNNISYNEFNEYILKDINLFDVPNDEYFKKIDETLNKIIETIPSIKRIFARPIVYLKDKQEIVPVEAVKVINNYTISHAALHSELWGDITKDGVKPKKLMTIEKIENFAIYENIAFCRLIDAILRYIRKSIILMKDILYGCQDIHFNVLDRTHHKLYFLAIGKLHMEYARAHEKHYSSYFYFIDKLLFIDKTLRSKLNSPVYVQCKKHKKKINLKKTNVFRSHKDYNQVYSLLKWFETDIQTVTQEELYNDVNDELYSTFVTVLSVFSIGHFNFEFSEKELIDFNNIDLKAKYLEWNLKLKKVCNDKINSLLFTFNKNKEYNICVILNDKNNIDTNDLTEFMNITKANEYLFVSPNNFGIRDTLYLTIYDIDSFRRIQQILLRGMIYCDTEHNICPFCGHKLENNEGTYECQLCRAEIKREKCSETNEEYYISSIKKYKSGTESFDSYKDKRKFLHDRYSEAQFHFRNITPLTNNGKVICPKCGKKHN